MRHRLFSGRSLRLVLALLLVAGLINYFRPLPEVKPSYDLAAPAVGTPTKISWPTQSQAAVGAVGYGVLAQHQSDKPVPIASVTKIMTALAVLEQKPLSAGQSGPTIILGDKDVDIYKEYLTKDGSVVPVNVGEKISQYQALQALLVPSGNNLADSLVRWAFGSMDSYLKHANQLAESLGLKDTNIADASGFSAKAVSTAHDLVLLGQAALAEPVIADIVSRTKVELPVAGTLNSTNWLLGTDGINGIKTGHTDEAGGCYLFSSRQVVAGHKVTLIGAVVGATDLTTAMNDSRPLIASIKDGFENVSIANRGQTVGYYDAPWGERVLITARQKLSVLNWRGNATNFSIDTQDIKASATAGSEVGSLSVDVGGQRSEVTLELSDKLDGPSWTWRLIRL